MALEQKLSLKLSQRLVMTPALQQAIKLLQMSTLELREEIATELQENPALEESLEQDGNEAEEQPPTQTADGATEQPSPSESDNGERDSLSEIDLEYMLQNYYDGGATTPRGSYEVRGEDRSWETNLTRPPDLSAHLLEQLTLATTGAVDDEIGRTIIGNLDSHGYLQASMDELVAMTDHDPADIQRVLGVVQAFDPAGVGARDLRECLLIQLRRLDLEDTPAAAIVREHLDLLEARRYEDLAHRLDLSPAQLREQMEILRRLDPHPGDRFSLSTTQTVTPDVMVVKLGDEYQVILNDDGFPRLRVSRYCRTILKGGAGASKDDREFVRQKLNAAVRLIKSIEERQRTIYKVACSIVRQQRPFLDHGINAIRPLVLRDVAEDVGVHESTVSRVVNNKYMHTPNGIFEMRFFFHSGLTNMSGEDISSLTVKESIRHIVDGEDSRHPLSDSAIAKILMQQEQIPIARRTVAKYREELRIPASTLRRRSVFGC
ncbi:MAG: RNA polymerase factor sigma-54 [Acidobacteria bacterium]|nr:RNA polymerase factor sigma-54 [Acidobacteriota bacterium]